MDDRLARRLGYPRPLDDGSYAVKSGEFAVGWYRLESAEFGRFVDGFARRRWVGWTDNVIWHLWLFSMFVFPVSLSSPTLFLMVVLLLISLVESIVRGKRFRAAFLQALPVRVRHRWWLWVGLAGPEKTIFCDGVSCLLLGWGVSDVFPDSYALMESYFEIPFYVFLSGISFYFWAVIRGVRVYYWATRKCRLSYQNLIKSEGGAPFIDAR